MFECKYKFSLEDCITSAKYVYKSQKRKKDKIVAIMIPILMVCMIAMLCYDIVKHKSVVWDVILLVALGLLESMYLLIPIMLVNSQKKAFKKQNLGDVDFLKVKIENNLCVETLIKNDQEIAKNVHNLKMLTSYLEDATRLILVFNNVEYVCLKKDAITGGDLKQFKAHLEKMMSKQKDKRK